MESFENWRKKQHLREVLLYFFFSKKTASESHNLFVETYGEYALSRTQCFEWFQRFASGDFDVKDKERPGQPKKFEDEELQALLDEDPSQTLVELSASLNVGVMTVWDRLEKMGMIQKQGYWVPHKLQARDVERRFSTCELLLERHNKKGFLHRVIAGDEKWIHYDNPKPKKYRAKRGELVPFTSTSTPKQEIYGTKVMLCIWWDQKGVIYYELLEPGETITGETYRRQLMRLNRALKEKRPETETRHDHVILQHDNARPHIAGVVQSYLETLRWEVLPHPPYSPDIAPTDYHLFRSMQDDLAGKHFQSYEEVKNWFDAFIASKPEHWFWNGIHDMPEKWRKVIACGGHYFK